MEIKRFYIMPEVWVTVSQSQVFNWIKLINEKGVSTDCISLTNKKLTDNEVKKIENSFNGKFLQFYNKKLLINDLVLFFNLFLLYLKNYKKYDKIVYQTRLSSIGLAFIFIRQLPKVRLIYESRGATGEERKHTHTHIVGLKMRFKQLYNNWSEKAMLYHSHKVIVVSNSLKNYYLNKHFTLSDYKFIVFPGAADSELFFYDERLRMQTRKELGIQDNEVVYVYSGRLDKKWEIPDKIIDFFKYILENKSKNVSLLLITPDTQIAFDLIKNKMIKDRVIIQSCSLSEVNKYLNALDIALLLREDILMNNVASPTKFAEYLMAGLPVIISQGIHDFAEIIRTTKFGAVVEDLEKVSNEEYIAIENSLKIDKNIISSWGENNLSKKVFIENYIKLLVNV